MTRHGSLEAVTRIDRQFLDSTSLMTHGLEVGARTQADSERAILQEFGVFRELRAHEGDFVDFAADAREPVVALNAASLMRAAKSSW